MKQSKKAGIIMPPVQVRVKVPFPGTSGGRGNWASAGTLFGDVVTTLHPHTKSDLLDQLNWLQRTIAATENDGLGGGTIIVLRRKATSEDET